MPRSDWRGLDVSQGTVAVNTTPNQLRPMHVGSSTKGYNLRRTGLTDKFKRTNDLTEFASKIWKHLRNSGMDSIAYIPDPRDATTMLSVVKEHPRLTIDYVRTVINNQFAKYDKYDLENDEAATDFLLDSIDKDLHLILTQKVQEGQPFPEFWLTLVTSVRSASIERFEAIKSSIKARSAINYAGQDIVALACDYRREALELVNAGQYGHNLTLHMLKTFIKAGGEGLDADNYRYILRAIYGKLNDALVTVGYMAKSDADDHMVKAKLTYLEVCEIAEVKYTAARDQGEWPPARSPHDSKAPPKTFGSAALAKAHGLTLVKSSSAGKDAERGACHNCGQKGHWARECPKKQGEKGKSKPQNGNKGANSWKLTAPAAGASEVKMHDGKQFRWCGKCSRWTTTHDTASHTSEPKKKVAVEPTANLMWDPHAFSAVSSSSSLWWICIPHVLLLFIGYFSASIVPLIVEFVQTQYETLPEFTISSILALLRLIVAYHKLIPSMVLWFCLYALIVYIGWFMPQPGKERGRRRTFRCWWKTVTTEKKRERVQNKSPGSICSHCFHRTYPRRLRNKGQFASRPDLPPTKGSFTSDLLGYEGRNQDVAQQAIIPPKQARQRGRRQVNHSFPQNGLQFDPALMGLTPTQVQAAQHVVNKFHMAQVGKSASAMEAILKAPLQLLGVMQKEATFPVIWDSGASISLSPSRADFVGPLEPSSLLRRVQGIGKSVAIKGEGHVAWSFLDTAGQLRTLKVPAYYVPGATARLLGTSSLLQTYPNETITVEADHMALSAKKGTKKLGTLIANVDPGTNLPTSLVYRYNVTVLAPQAYNVTLTEVSQANLNLTEPEKELLRWHFRLGHLSFKKIQFLLGSGVVSHSESARRIHAAACKVTTYPRCAACQFGKQCRRPAPGVVATAVKDRAGVLKQGDLLPGQRVSVDHFASSVKGRLFTSRGKTSDDSMYCGGCIFVDHASSYIHIEFQNHLTSHETAKAKEDFESVCRDFGVVPQNYQADNGSAFTSAGFSTHLSRFMQVIRFAGAGAHHHNGNAERAIRTVMSIARTMLLHSAIHWPELADPALWPMAVSHAVYLINHMPNPSTGWSPHDLFSRQRWEQRKFADLHVWGCPTYVLEKRLSDGMKIPRWQPRSKRSMYMGVSVKHASSVPLLLNPESGAITAQFHIVFDDWFATIARTVADLPDFNSFAWQQLFGDCTYAIEDGDDDNDAAVVLDPADTRVMAHRDRVAGAIDVNAPAIPLPIVANPVPFVPPTPAVPAPVPRAILPTGPPTPVPVRDQPLSPPREPMSAPREQLFTPREPLPIVASPVANPVPPFPIVLSPLPAGELQRETAPRGSGPIGSPPQPSRPQRVRRAPQRLIAEVASVDHSFLFAANARSLAASRSDPDTVTFEQAMLSPNRTEWITAAGLEVSSLEAKGTWEEVPFDSARTKILPGTWVFKIKRGPDGTVRKYNARYCVRGDLMQGSDEETHSPVVSWSSVRVFLVLALTLGWYTCTVDFSNAFVQAKLEKPVWVHLPRGFLSSHTGKTVLKLKKSLYGLTFASRLWHEHLLKALHSLGFKASATDPCLLFRSDMMLIVYVDDVGVATPDKKAADKLVQDLLEQGFELTREGSFSEFLGIKLECNTDSKALTLTQSGLIKRIIEVTDMADCKPNWTPASQLALGSDPDGEPMDDTWSYRSVVGMLLYLSTNTRPDIAFAVSQVARFCFAPKKTHATAVKMIIRYLARTVNCGTIINPTGRLDLECYVDADFSGLFKREPDADPNCARSRTGYIITLGGAPLTWKSQLQTEICLSTLESEYVALSASLRVLLRIKRLLQELTAVLNLPDELRASISCVCFEDNTGALLLATTHRLTGRTRYMSTKNHWFWFHYDNGEFDIRCVGTTLQQANYLTKGTAREPFGQNRFLIQGW